MDFFSTQDLGVESLRSVLKGCESTREAAAESTQ
jgi:hypothetical protein